MGKKFGTDSIYNTGVESFSNRGNFGEMDWFDIAVGTFNPFRKDKYAAFGSELLNSTFDVKFNTGATSIFDQSKSGDQFLLEFGLGQARALSAESFDLLGVRALIGILLWMYQLGKLKVKVKSCSKEFGKTDFQNKLSTSNSNYE